MKESRANRVMRAAAVISTLLMLAGSEGSGQVIKFNFGKKKIPVTINHPPTLRIALKGKSVVVNPSVGSCAQQFEDQLSQDFLNNGVTLLDRANMDTILREHHFQFSSSVDPNTAVEFGKISGAAAMIFANVTRCDARRAQPLEEQQFVGPPVHVSRTEAHFQASIRTVDLATGRVLGTNQLQSDPKKENRGQGTLWPEYPGIEEVQDAAVRAAVAQANRLYFPWVETREVSFMDSKGCNLKQAYDLLKTGDIESVLKLSLDNVERCKSDPKPSHQADALYNLGVAYMLSHDFDHALSALNDSLRLHSDKEVIEAINECKRMRVGEQAVARTQAQDTVEEAKEKDEERRKTKEVEKATLTNDDVVQFAKELWSDDLIIKTIATQPTRFSLAIADLRALKQAGVSDKVIAAMLDKK